MVEKSRGKKVTTIRTDSGGEYTSTEFEEYLWSEEIGHEFTIHKAQAEWMDRTLPWDGMFNDVTLPHKFWAETLTTVE